jgi:beta-glucosidase
VDFETLERTPKASYFWLQELIEERDLAAAAGAAIAQAAAADDLATEAPDDGVAPLGATA